MLCGARFCGWVSELHVFQVGSAELADVSSEVNARCPSDSQALFSGDFEVRFFG